MSKPVWFLWFLFEMAVIAGLLTLGAWMQNLPGIAGWIGLGLMIIGTLLFIVDVCIWGWSAVLFCVRSLGRAWRDQGAR